MEALHAETGVQCTVVLPALPVSHAPVFSNAWPARPVISTLSRWWDDQKAALAERAAELAARVESTAARVEGTVHAGTGRQLTKEQMIKLTTQLAEARKEAESARVFFVANIVSHAAAQTHDAPPDPPCRSAHLVPSIPIAWTG